MTDMPSIDEETDEETAVQQPVYDDIIVEDLPEDYEIHEHEQLPSVEEAKASLSKKPAWSCRKTLLLAYIILAVVVAGAITGTIVSFAKNKSNESQLDEGRTARVIQFLFATQVSDLPDLKNRNAPQHLAAAFVADGDIFHEEMSGENARRFVERYVLTLIYYQLGGQEWTYNLKFLSGRDHCEWWDKFSTSAGDTLHMGVLCDENGFVTKLNLAYNNLIGNRIPDEIKHLSELEILHMHFNHIGGYFPEGFRHMSKLKGIGLMNCGLQGGLPSWIGEMTQLTTLGLGNNQFNGEVPESINNLHNLKILGLDDNDGLTGSLDRFKSLKSLEALYLESNAFSGSLENFNWPNLVELDASNNMLDGSIPATLVNHPKLEALDLHNNVFFGTFPDDIFQNGNLKYLAIHNNEMTGSIPDRLAFVSNLRHLDVSFNMMTGTIPDTLTQLTELRYWATSGNRFTSQTILDLSRLSNLQDLSMKHNNLIGTIPGWVGGLSSLQLLDLDANELTGTIPSWIGLLRDLDHLLLNRNKLTGTIPVQMQNLFGLQVLLLDGNSIRGNANAICESDSVQPSYFVSDCYPGQNGERAEIECRCCTQCCTDDDPSCNDKKWTSNVDPIWEYGYVRTKYTFMLENAPAIYSKEGGTDDATHPVDPLDSP